MKLTGVGNVAVITAEGVSVPVGGSAKAMVGWGGVIVGDGGDEWVCAVQAVTPRRRTIHQWKSAFFILGILALHWPVTEKASPAVTEAQRGEAVRWKSLLAR